MTRRTAEVAPRSAAGPEDDEVGRREPRRSHGGDLYGAIDGWRKALDGFELKLVGPNRWQALIDGTEIDIVSDGRVRASAPLSESVGGMRIIRHEHALGSVPQLVTGDRALGELAAIHGPVELLAMFSANVRKTLCTALESGVVFGAGAMTLSSEQATDIKAGLRAMAALSKILKVPKQAHKRIADIAAEDPDPIVRAAYAAVAGESSEVETATKQRRVKKAAADPESFEALKAIVKDEGVAFEVLREAWAKLLTLFPVAEVEPLFARVEHRAVIDLIMGRLSQRAREPGVDLDGIASAMLALTKKRGKPEVSAAIGLAEVFAKAEYRPAIPWLVAQLARGDSKELGRAALHALMVLPVHAEVVMRELDKVPEAVDLAVGYAPAVGFVAHEGGATLGPLVGGLYQTVTHALMRVAYLELFEAVGDPRHAPLAVAALDDDDEQVVVAALGALAVIGWNEHYKPVVALTKGFFRNGQVKDAARRAAEAIKGRLPREGALSIAEGGEGQLGLSEGNE